MDVAGICFRWCCRHLHMSHQLHQLQSTAEPCWVDPPNQLVPVAVVEDPDAPTSTEGEESGPTYVAQPHALAGVLALLRGWGCEG